MKFMLDSHTLLWTLYEPELLPAGVASAISDSAHQLYVSHISVLELTDKAVKFRLPKAGSAADRIIEHILGLGVTMTSVELADIAASVKLPRHHDDPLDRILIAQAQRLSATLLSRDGKFGHYDVPVFWR
jgi:PIN domain nuclease of toxin-antitoxin system